MLERFHRLAGWLWPLRRMLWGLAFAAAVTMSTLVLGLFGSGRAVFLALAVLMWMACLLMVTYGFSGSLPVMRRDLSWFGRASVRLRRGGLQAAAFLTTLLTVLVAFMTLRALLLFGRG